MSEKLSEDWRPKFLSTRIGRTAFGGVLGFGVGYGGGELAQVLNDNLIHYEHNLPPLLVGGIGALAAGIALYRAKTRHEGERLGEAS